MTIRLKATLIESAYRPDNGPGINYLQNEIRLSSPFKKGTLRFNGLLTPGWGGGWVPTYLSDFEATGERKLTGNTPGLANPEACKESPAHVGGGYGGSVSVIMAETPGTVQVHRALVRGKKSIATPRVRGCWRWIKEEDLAACLRLGIDPLPRLQDLFPTNNVKLMEWKDLFGQPEGYFIGIDCNKFIVFQGDIPWEL